MKKLFSYRWLVGAFIALFFAMQSYGAAHASAYGDSPHDHDGVACSVTVVSNDHIAIAPPPPVTPLITSDSVETVYPDFTSVTYLRPQGRAPPPRGPPTSI
ncbi:hypothetical protein N9M10_01685 [Hellea sp.]|nr:hypothetical protein [Hellea sp.]